MVILEGHDCHLQTQEEDVVNQVIDVGVCICFRRKFRKMCLISRQHPMTWGHLQSHAAWRNEQIRNLVQYYYMIHPFSMLDLYWNFFMFFVFAAQYLILPIDALFPVKRIEFPLFLTKFFVDTIQLIDIVKIFLTGYYDDHKSKVILKRSAIAKRYLTTYFIFDVVSLTSTYLNPLIMLMCNSVPNRIMLMLRLTNRLRIVRMDRWLSIMDLFRQYMGYSNYLFRGIRVVLIFIVITFWAFSITFFVHNYFNVAMGLPAQTVTDLMTICKSYFNATLMLLAVSYGVSMDSIVEYISTIFFLCFGFALQMFLFAQILQVWTKYSNARNRHHSLQKQFKEYMKYKVLPISLREKIYAYFEYKFYNQFFRENDINNIISPILKQEIRLHITREHIERVHIFKQLPEHILMKVVSYFNSEIFLPGDTIVSAGSPGNCMFFIYHGTVAVYSPQGKELCHLDDGDHFGEIALIFNETRVANVIAVTPCELFLLKRSDFLKIIEPFPEINEQLKSLATERLHEAVGQ